MENGQRERDRRRLEDGNRTFFSLEELNVAIAELLEKLNTRPFRSSKDAGVRRSRASIGQR